VCVQCVCVQCVCKCACVTVAVCVCKCPCVTVAVCVVTVTMQCLAVCVSPCRYPSPQLCQSMASLTITHTHVYHGVCVCVCVCLLTSACYLLSADGEYAFNAGRGGKHAHTLIHTCRVPVMFARVYIQSVPPHTHTNTHTRARMFTHTHCVVCPSHTHTLMLTHAHTHTHIHTLDTAERLFSGVCVTVWMVLCLHMCICVCGM